MAVSLAEARGLLRDLVDIPSVSGQEDDCAARLGAFFDEHRRDVWIDEIGNVRAPADDAVLLTSHVDTVPGRIPVRVENGELWGRGSVDAKGSLAAMAVASVRSGVSFAGVVGEEHDSRGARYLVDSRDPPAAVINGEPSGWNGITVGYRGHVKGFYAVETPSVHTARPDANAIETAVEWWSRVARAFPVDKTEPVFEQVTAKPIAVRGGRTDDGMAVAASIEVTFRVPPDWSVAEVRDRVNALVTDGLIEWELGIPAVMMTPRSEVARLFRVAIRDLGGEPRLLRKTGTSDMNLFADAWSCPMVTYGPGDSDLDHTPEERISLEEYDRSVRVLERVCSRLRNAEEIDP